MTQFLQLQREEAAIENFNNLSHFVDLSIAEYVVETRDLNDIFKLFMSLGSGSTIGVTQANLDFLLSCSRELGNSSLYVLLMEHFDTDFLCSQIRDSTILDLFREGLISRISSDFYGLTWSEFDVIPGSVLFDILSHHLLNISSEDDLFSYIRSRSCSNPEYFDLLQLVHIEYVSSECVGRFFSSVPDWIDRRVWESISQRLISPVDTDGEFPLKASLVRVPKQFEGPNTRKGGVQVKIL
jgi:hypothetical protein